MLWVLTGLPLDNLEKYSLKINPPSTLLKRFGKQFLLDSSCPDLLHAISQVLRGSPGSSRSKIPSSERALTAMVSGLNLNNEVFEFYQGSSQFPIQREYYKPTYTFGLRGELGREK